MASERDGMPRNGRYATVSFLFSALWVSQDSQGMCEKVSRGLELCPGGLLTSVGLSVLSYRGVFAQKLGARVL